MRVSETLSLLAAVLLTSPTNAFTISSNVPSSTTTALGATNSDRRAFFRNAAGVAFGAAAVATNGQEASASYSAYSNREKDWQERKDSGDVQFMNSRELKAQLREIAPMNNESAKLFCPNGPSSNVSPLMENKCGDRMATPSVFGRTNDIVGNSIPGFTGGKYGGVGDSSSLTAEAGGFPKY